MHDSDTRRLGSVKAGRSGRLVRKLGKIVLDLVKRVYAIGLVAVVLWLSWKAFYYLVAALMLPSTAPPQVIDLPKRYDETMLARPVSEFAGVQATENPRGPLSHYHRLNHWFELEGVNACTSSGCHAPLPHGKEKADRAFLNMHATSIHCGVCHIQMYRVPLDLTWYDIKSGERQDTPDLLKAYAWLIEWKSRTPSNPTEQDQKEIVKLLHAAARAVHKEPVLEHLADHLAAVRVQSERFTKLLDVAIKTVPRYFRGEYGAKIALVDPESGRPRLGHPGNEDSVRQYLEQKDVMSDIEKHAILKRIHPLRRDPTLRCEECHQPRGALVDLAALGYPEGRIQDLVQSLIMKMIDNIRTGGSFHMLGFLGPGSISQPF